MALLFVLITPPSSSFIAICCPPFIHPHSPSFALIRRHHCTLHLSLQSVRWHRFLHIGKAPGSGSAFEINAALEPSRYTSLASKYHISNIHISVCFVYCQIMHISNIQISFFSQRSFELRIAPLSPSLSPSLSPLSLSPLSHPSLSPLLGPLLSQVARCALRSVDPGRLLPSPSWILPTVLSRRGGIVHEQW